MCRRSLYEGREIYRVFYLNSHFLGDIMKSKNFSFRCWWYGLVEDLHLACESELQALEEPIRRNVQGFIAPIVDLPRGWRCLSAESLSNGDMNLIICDSYKCLYDSLQHKAIRSRYSGKIFQRRLGFFQPVILSISGLLGIVSFVLQCVK